MKVVAQNKKALFDYQIFDRLEAGIVLTGDEVKSIRAGQISLAGAFATIHDGELFLINCNITPYEKAFRQPNKDQASRSRKLLVHRRELNRLVGETSQKGMTLVALKAYLTEKGKVKVELGIAKHKKAAGKKQTIKERDIDRQARRELKDVYKY